MDKYLKTPQLLQLLSWGEEGGSFAKAESQGLLKGESRLSQGHSISLPFSYWKNEISESSCR